MDSKVLDVLKDRVLELGPKPDASGPYRNFKLTRDADGVAWVLFHDYATGSASATNALTKQVALADALMFVLPLTLVFGGLTRYLGAVDAASGRVVLDDPETQTVPKRSPIGMQFAVYVVIFGLALAKLVEAKSGVDAVFLTGDVLAAGAVLEAGRRGWRVPRDVAIAGSDDNELQENITPPLTSIRFPRYEIGRNAARLLLDRVETESAGSVVMDLGFRIIERQST